MTTHRPARLSATLSVVVAAAALAVVATTGDQRLVIGGTLLALVPVAAGGELRWRGHRLAGLLAGAVGTAGVVGAVAFAVASLGRLSYQLELLPGLLGLYVLVLALGPIREGSERFLISCGAGLVLLSVLTGAAVYEADRVAVLAGGIGSVLAWDLAERAVNVGEQVGREPRTVRVELLHAGATAAVGVLAVGAALLFVRIGVGEVPLPVLAGLLGAGLTLTLALYN